MSRTARTKSERPSPGDAPRSGAESGAGELPWKDEAGAEARRAFYAAAVAFEQARPWAIAGDSQLVELRAPALGRERACLSVLGAAGRSFGLLLFDSVADYVAVTRRASRQPGAPASETAAAVLGVHFEEPRELPAGERLAQSARAHGWTSGQAGRIPLVVRMGVDGEPQPVGEADYRLATACLETVGVFVEGQRSLFRPPSESRASREARQQTLRTADGLELTLVAPAEVPWEWGREEPIAGLRRKDAEALVQGFRAERLERGGEEAEVAKVAGHVAEALRYRLSRGEPAERWSADDVQAYLLDYYPAKGVAADEDLALLPQSLASFFAWLAARPGADAEALDIAATRVELCREAFLTYARDPRRYSQSKTLVRAARAEGVDLGDPKALDAFVRGFKRRLARDPSLLPAAGPAPRKAWIWRPGDPTPDPKGECPCGSGKRYRKCCMPR